MNLKRLSVAFVAILIVMMNFGFSKGKKKKDRIDGFVFIPMGSSTIGGKTFSVDSYWISDHEVSNSEYNMFLSDLKNNGRIDEYKICMVDSMGWRRASENSYSEPYDKHYSSHLAYANYPVLNISHEAAQKYCDWLTEKSEDKTQQYRLPTKEEWMYAASGGLDHVIYAWGGKYMRNKKGEHMCNYLSIGDALIHVDSLNNFQVMAASPNSIAFGSITSPVDSYWPNEYGLYNACGNVAEMIDEKGVAMGGSWKNTGFDVQITSEQKYSGPNPFVGFRPVRVKK